MDRRRHAAVFVAVTAVDEPHFLGSAIPILSDDSTPCMYQIECPRELMIDNLNRVGGFGIEALHVFELSPVDIDQDGVSESVDIDLLRTRLWEPIQETVWEGRRRPPGTLSFDKQGESI